MAEDTSQKKELDDWQDFIVVAPRYKLPNGSVHSVYPPQGHTENVEILPHVVLNDPQLPWARRVVNNIDPKDRNRVPWLAMLIFRQEELRYPKATQQGNTLAVTLTLGALGDLVTASDSDCTSPVVKSDGSTYDDDSKDLEADFIFVPKNIFDVLFKDDEKEETQTLCDVSRYQWLAHTRNINTIGMANSGIDGEEGVFSVVISQRAGPLDITEPTDLVVHLVSIEHVSGMPYPAPKDRVTLCSLESWSYTCLPPDSFNVYDAFRNIGRKIDGKHDVLRIDLTQFGKSLSGKQLPDRLRDRLVDGFVMTKYRTQTGEETAAWVRGPLVPTLVNHGDVETCISHTGTDLQIMDRETGIMDITYSVAWQLGKALALADQGYTTALGRLRLTISRAATDETKKSILKAHGSFQGQHETLCQLAESMKTLRTLQDATSLSHGRDARWLPSSFVSVDMPRWSSCVQQHFRGHVARETERLTVSASDDYVYNEFNTPLSPDWMIVLSWILDRIYLAGVPAHYYIPDPSYLPQESLRFFHIDRYWIDALVDGALSVSSHLRNDDDIRRELKKMINKYLQQKPEGLHYPPQRPGYGFLLRSELCVKFPDLIVEAYARNKDEPDPTIIVRQENIAEGVLLVMFDKKPGSDFFGKLILREPPHQQAFCCGESLKPTYLEVLYKKIYTIPLEEQAKRSNRTSPVETLKHYPEGGDDKGGYEGPIFTWAENETNVHALRLPAYVQQIHNVLGEELKEDYTETEPTATLLGIQLNHPMLYLEIQMEPSLFTTSDQNSADDGMLAGLRMLRSPASPLPKAWDNRPEDQLIFSYSAPVDWNAPFVAWAEESPGRQENAQGHDFFLPAPHLRRLALTDRAPITITKPLKGDPRDGEVGVESRIENLLMAYSIYSLADPSVKDKLTRKNFKQDLIFSSRRNPDNDNWILKQITISFPYGQPDRGRATLMDFYDGPGATMVTDFRFNVAPTLSKNTEDKLVFHLTIAPRAGSIVMRNLTNLSLILSGVMLADYTKWSFDRGDPAVEVNIQEIFVDRNPQTAKFYLPLNI
ncbi:hypothetical protein EYZ11_010522 [Aspergillus tanneri]|nr:hypothetical protein EYZ11_010522 [Aspergillus tanneri]